MRQHRPEGVREGGRADGTLSGTERPNLFSTLICRLIGRDAVDLVSGWSNAFLLHVNPVQQTTHVNKVATGKEGNLVNGHPVADGDVDVDVDVDKIEIFVATYIYEPSC